ncbi:copper oxidase, partial [Miniimonas arenae]
MNRRSLYVPANALVLAWFVAAAAVAIAHRFVPVAGWLMVHLLLLGGVSTAILLWSQHFAETLTRRPAPGGPRLLWTRLLGWSAGAAIVTAGMVTSATPLVVAGSVVLTGVAVTHVVVLARQRKGSGRMLGNRLGHLVRYYLLATAFLPVGVAFGVLLARVDTTPEVAGRLYVAHVAATLLGWVGLTVAGTIVLLWPTVLRTRLTPAAEAAGKHALAVLGAGIAVVLAGPATGWRPLVLAGSVVVAAGLARIGWHVIEQGRAAARTHGTGSFAAWSLAASCAWFLLAVLAFGVAVLGAPGWAAVPDRLTWLVAPFAVGFVAQVMLGSMSYLVPVVLGGGPGVVRWSNAAMDRGGMTRFTVLNLALVVFLLPAPSWVLVASSMVGLLPLLAFLVVAVRTIAVQRSERTRRTLEPLAPGVATTAHWRPVPMVGGAAAGVAIVTLAMVAGIAVD